MEFLFDIAEFAIIVFGSFGGGFWAHKRVSINYKDRWKEAIELLKAERLGTADLKEIEEGGTWIRLPDQAAFKKLMGFQRLDLEEHRLKKGLPPADAFGGATPECWTKGRKMQLQYGWEYCPKDNQNGYRKVDFSK